MVEKGSGEMHRRYYRLVSLLSLAVILFASAPHPVAAQEKTAAALILLQQSTESDYKHQFTFVVRARTSATRIVTALLFTRFSGDPTYFVQRAAFSRRQEIGASVSWD